MMQKLQKPLKLLLKTARTSSTLAAEASAEHRPRVILESLRSWRLASGVSPPGRSAAGFWYPAVSKVVMPGGRLSVGFLGRGAGSLAMSPLLQRMRFNSRGFFSAPQRFLNNLTPDEVVYGLIGANVAVFLLWRIADTTFMRKNFMISLDNIKNGRLHTMLTSAFSHADADHIISNMLGLYFFGRSIANLFGPEFLLKMYVAGALGGSIFFLVHKAYLSRSEKGYHGSYFSGVPGLGASAAVNAIILLDVFLFPMNMVYIQLVIPVPAFVMGAIFIGTDVWRMTKGDTRVSGSAHLGGAAVAAIAFARIKGWIRF